MKTNNNTKTANGIYISLEEISSIILGASKFSSISFSRPLPIEQTKKICGSIPIKDAQKKFLVFTLKIQGSTFEIAKGIPPINL